MTKIAIARVLHDTPAEGPHRRSAVWVRGCSIRCAGCINPHLFAFESPTTDVQKLATAIVATGVEGLTLLGGEPFDQAGACAELANAIRSAGLGVITFTGYTHESLSSGTRDQRRLVQATDLLVDGPFMAERRETERSLVGSTNQRFVHLTDRYQGFQPTEHPNRLDVRISPEGETRLAGFLRPAELRHIQK